jgi:hypothetical protein
MAERPVGITDQASGAGIAQVRTRERTVASETVAEQYVIPISERVASFKGIVTSFRTLGNAASPQNLFSIENAAGSTVLLAIRRMSIQMDATVANTSVACSFKTSRPTAVPTGGTTLSKVSFDSTQSSSSSVVARGATASDGGAATAITATAGSIGWSQFAMRLHTGAGQVTMDDQSLVPTLCEDDPIILRAGEALLVQVTNATAANNLATNHYIVNAMFEEFTLP